LLGVERSFPAGAAALRFADFVVFAAGTGVAGLVAVAAAAGVAGFFVL